MVILLSYIPGMKGAGASTLGPPLAMPCAESRSLETLLLRETAFLVLEASMRPPNGHTWSWAGSCSLEPTLLTEGKILELAACLRPPKRLARS